MNKSTVSGNIIVADLGSAVASKSVVIGATDFHLHKTKSMANKIAQLISSIPVPAFSLRRRLPVVMAQSPEWSWCLMAKRQAQNARTDSLVPLHRYRVRSRTSCSK